MKFKYFERYPLEDLILQWRHQIPSESTCIGNLSAAPAKVIALRAIERESISDHRLLDDISRNDAELKVGDAEDDPILIGDDSTDEAEEAGQDHEQADSDIEFQGSDSQANQPVQLEAVQPNPSARFGSLCGLRCQAEHKLIDLVSDNGTRPVILQEHSRHAVQQPSNAEAPGFSGLARNEACVGESRVQINEDSQPLSEQGQVEWTTTADISTTADAFSQSYDESVNHPEGTLQLSEQPSHSDIPNEMSIMREEQSTRAAGPIFLADVGLCTEAGGQARLQERQYEYVSEANNAAPAWSNGDSQWPTMQPEGCFVSTGPHASESHPEPSVHAQFPKTHQAEQCLRLGTHFNVDTDTPVQPEQLGQQAASIPDTMGDTRYNSREGSTGSFVSAKSQLEIHEFSHHDLGEFMQSQLGAPEPHDLYTQPPQYVHNLGHDPWKNSTNDLPSEPEQDQMVYSTAPVPRLGNFITTPTDPQRPQFAAWDGQVQSPPDSTYSYLPSYEQFPRSQFPEDFHQQSYSQARHAVPGSVKINSWYGPQISQPPSPHDRSEYGMNINQPSRFGESYAPIQQTGAVLRQGTNFRPPIASRPLTPPTAELTANTPSSRKRKRRRRHKDKGKIRSESQPLRIFSSPDLATVASAPLRSKTYRATNVGESAPSLKRPRRNASNRKNMRMFAQEDAAAEAERVGVHQEGEDEFADDEGNGGFMHNVRTDADFRGVDEEDEGSEFEDDE